MKPGFILELYFNSLRCSAFTCIFQSFEGIWIIFKFSTAAWAEGGTLCLQVLAPKGMARFCFNPTLEIMPDLNRSIAGDS